MEEKKRRMGFWEIGKKTKNPLIDKVQALFEQAQIEAAERGVKTSVSLHIHIKPPDDEAKWGKVSFDTSMSAPKDKSREFTTELIDGIAIASGDSQADLLQYSLEFPDAAKSDNLMQFEKAQSGT